MRGSMLLLLSAAALAAEAQAPAASDIETPASRGDAGVSPSPPDREPARAAMRTKPTRRPKARR